MTRGGSSCSASDSGPILRSGTLFALLFVAFLPVYAVFFPGSAAAESPIEVADELSIDGVYIAPGREEMDEEGLAASIQQARARGLRLVVVAPIDPQPDAASFARRIQEASDADAAIVFPAEGGLEAHVIDEFESARLRALGTARSKASPVAAVEAFSEELLTEPNRALPSIVGQIVAIVVLLALALAGAVAIEQLLRRLFRGRGRRRRRQSEYEISSS